MLADSWAADNQPDGIVKIPTNVDFNTAYF